MKTITRIALALACSALVSGSAFAAINADAIHLALDSLLVASSKLSVINVMRKNHGPPPANNAAANLGAPESMTTSEISRIVVSDGVINVYLAPVSGTDQGIVQYVPKLVKGPRSGKAVEFVCNSPNIPDIATVVPSCKYVPRN
ncbi:MAG: hypothetical protein ACREPP_02505 [Rhodanobacteraceae bacterium]